MKRSRREIKRLTRVKMRNAAPDQPEHGGDHAGPQQYGNFPDGGDTPVQQHHQQNHQPAGNQLRLPPSQRM
jgi:hypothetical protein